MNKDLCLTLTAATLLFLTSCGQTPTTNSAVPPATATVSHDSHGPQAASTQPKDGLYPAKGKVTKINNELGSVELDHERIVGVMEPMLMEFYVKNKALLNGIAVGDSVDFILEYKHPSETIVEITKSK